MNRRERHVRIIEWMGAERTNYALAGMLARKDSRRLEIFTDAAIEELAARLVSDRKFSNRLNAENRARRAAK